VSLSDHPYANRRIGLATMHAKERAVAPAFRRVLGADVVPVANLDTDTLGTFSGEVPRPDALVETALIKADLVFRTMDVDCALASEGSYGPIDRLPLTASGVEVMAFVDRRRGVRFVETLATHRTNWKLLRFKAGDPSVPIVLKSMGFPEYGVFVICSSNWDHPVKGLSTEQEVIAAMNREAEKSDDKMAVLVTDMRAHRNPMRMKVVRALSWKLAKRLQRLCPTCKAPGFGHIESRRGLPCEACGDPTDWIHFEVDGCSACGHAAARPRKDGRRTASRLSCRSCRAS
jgi:ribosomal protein L37E